MQAGFHALARRVCFRHGRRISHLSPPAAFGRAALLYVSFFWNADKLAALLDAVAKLTGRKND